MDRSRRQIPDSANFEILVRLFLKPGKSFIKKDVDNLLKDIFDALQGMFGDKGKIGRGGKERRRCVLPNDSKIWRVLIEKEEHVPKLGRESIGGYLWIREFKPLKWPIQLTGGKTRRR
jgi:hypothetical protein